MPIASGAGRWLKKYDRKNPLDNPYAPYEPPPPKKRKPRKRPRPAPPVKQEPEEPLQEEQPDRKEPEPDKRPEPEPEKKKEPEPEPEPETKKEPEPEPKPEPEKKKEPEPEKKKEPEPKPEPEPEKKKEPEPEKKKEPEPKPPVVVPAPVPVPVKTEEKPPPVAEPEPPPPKQTRPSPRDKKAKHKPGKPIRVVPVQESEPKLKEEDEVKEHTRNVPKPLKEPSPERETTPKKEPTPPPKKKEPKVIPLIPVNPRDNPDSSPESTSAKEELKLQDIEVDRFEEVKPEKKGEQKDTKANHIRPQNDKANLKDTSQKETKRNGVKKDNVVNKRQAPVAVTAVVISEEPKPTQQKTELNNKPTPKNAENNKKNNFWRNKGKPGKVKTQHKHGKGVFVEESTVLIDDGEEKVSFQCFDKFVSKNHTSNQVQGLEMRPRLLSTVLSKFWQNWLKICLAGLA